MSVWWTQIMERFQRVVLILKAVADEMRVTYLNRSSKGSMWSHLLVFGWLLTLLCTIAAVQALCFGKHKVLPVGNTAGYQSGRPCGCVVSTLRRPSGWILSVSSASGEPSSAEVETALDERSAGTWTQHCTCRNEQRGGDATQPKRLTGLSIGWRGHTSPGQQVWRGCAVATGPCRWGQGLPSLWGGLHEEMCPVVELLHLWDQLPLAMRQQQTHNVQKLTRTQVEFCDIWF